MEHPSPDVLLRFLLGTASRPENRQVVRHLLVRCPSCAATLRQLRREPPLGPPPDPGAYDPAFDRAETYLENLARKTGPPRRLALVDCSAPSRHQERSDDLRMGDVNDPLDDLGPDELVEAASKSLLQALAHLDSISRTLRGHRETARPTHHASPSPVGEGPGERAWDQTRSSRKRGPYPRRVK